MTNDEMWRATNEQRKTKMLCYIKLKIDEEDWHGAIDGLMDLRDLYAEMVGYDKAKKNERAARND